MTPEQLGFDQRDETSWLRSVRGQNVIFRTPRTLAELTPIEAIQRGVFGATDLDIYAAGQLLSFIEAGGFVITAEINDRLAGAVIGLAGFANGVPFLLSDWAGVYPAFRSAGIGTDLKRLQACLALAGGFREIRWTVDPLRAANAHLNFERLGAWSNHYEIDRYGNTYGESLYGGLPSDRLHITWSIADPAVQQHLLADGPERTNRDVLKVPHFHPRSTDKTALIFIPNDIDAILAADANAALRWRLILRETLPVALSEGFRVTGFAPAVAGEGDLSALILTRRRTAR